MIERIVNSITGWLIKECELSSEQFEIYRYGVFCVVMKIIPIVPIALFGWAMGCIGDVIIVCALFVILRRSSGGYHAKTPERCVLLSVGAFILATIFVKIYYVFSAIVLIIEYALSAIIVFVKAPRLNENKHYTDIGIKILARKTKLLIGIISVGFIWLMVTGNMQLCVDIAVAMMMVSIAILV